MIVGRNPSLPVIGGTVLSQADKTFGSGTLVDADELNYEVYWRNGRSGLCWHAREDLVIPRLDYETAMTTLRAGTSLG
jgi:hypothetical protein